jgi:hypothetical protein
MKTNTSSSDSIATLYFFIAAALGIYGLSSNLVFLGAAFLFAGAGLLRNKRQHLAGLLAAFFGLAFSSVVFFYGIGKDMALRDNALNKPSASAKPVEG